LTSSPSRRCIVKGKAEPVQAYLVRRAKPRAWRMASRGVEGIETRMVGREVELLMPCGRPTARSWRTRRRVP
jgi:hypothetical protein